MAIVTMKKLSLLAMQADKDGIFDALIRTRSTELRRSADVEACTRRDVSSSREKYAVDGLRVEEAISYVTETAVNYNALHKRDKAAQADIPKNSFARPLSEIDYDYFLGFGQRVERIERELTRLSELKQSISANEARIAHNRGELERLSLIANLPHPTNWYRDTDSSFVRLMQINGSEAVNLKSLADGYDLVDVDVLDVVNGVALVVAVAHKTETEFFEKASAYGLVNCSVVCDVLPKAMIEDIERQTEGLIAANAELTKEVVGFADSIPEWKVYSDYLGLLDAKLSAEGDLTNTDSTFVLEAYYPAESEQKVIAAIDGVTGSYVLNCEDIGEDEFAPTLLKNNKAVKKFEGVTNMYSPPAYHEIDPNPVMSVFYFIIFGFMVADIGYGLLLLLAGIAATFAIKQQTGVKTMLQMFGICGLSAVAVGALFGSVFCYSVYDGVIPAPDKYPMVMMIISLVLGIVHICAGIGCKMAVKLKHKQYLSAWLADFPWIITFASLVVAVFNMAMDMAAYEPWSGARLPDIVTQIALYVCLASLAVGIIFAGLGQKGILSKFKSSFGSAYGIINYFSDLMSYIRVFGLMLSGSLVGSVFNDLGAMVAGDGKFGVGYILAGLLLVLMHVFNLAISVLSVYIHDGRLQYVEFFGKFYEGDGELFKPFGDVNKYTLIKEDKLEPTM